MSKNKNRNRYSGYGKPNNQPSEAPVEETEQQSPPEETQEQEDAIPFVPTENDVLEAEAEAAEDPIEEALEEAIEKVTEAEEKTPDIVKEDGVRIPTIAQDPPFLSGGQRKVKSEKLRLRKDPSKVGDVLSLLDRDTIITIDNSFKDDIWAKVVDVEGNLKGYVMKEFLSPYA